MFGSLGRSLGAVVASLFIGLAAMPSHASFFEPAEMRGITVGGPVGLAWDTSIRNDFGWVMASSKIATACATGRVEFEAYVAMAACASFGGGQGAGGSNAGGGGAGGGGGGGAGAAFAGIWDDTLPPPIELTPVVPGMSEATVIPLPAAGWLLVSGLGGLVYLRRRQAQASLRA